MYLVYKDWPYREYTKSMDFWLSKNYENVFYGYAESFGGEPVEIFINRLALQYLSPTPLPGTETGFTTGVFTHPNMMGRFTLWTVGEPLVYDKCFVYGFGGEIDTTKDSVALSNPINGRLDPRMYVLFTKAGTVATTEEIIGTGSGETSTFELIGDFTFVASGGTNVFTAQTQNVGSFTASTTSAWLTVSQNGDTITVSAAANTDDSRSATLLIDWVDERGISHYSKTYSLVQLEQTDMKKRHLTFEALNSGTIVWTFAGDAAIAKAIQYSRDNGNTWTPITSTAAGSVINVTEGEKILFKGDTNGTSSGATDSGNFNCFSGGTALYDVYGNICSIAVSSGYETWTPQTNGFKGLFRSSNAVDASRLFLPSPTINFQYRYLFRYSLTLVDIPDFSHFQTYTNYCLAGTFSYCSSITEVRNLPNVTSSISVTRPFAEMFANCGFLDYVENYSLITTSELYNNWLQGVSAEGTFVKNQSASWSSDASGIPSGWTIVNE